MHISAIEGNIGDDPDILTLKNFKEASQHQGWTRAMEEEIKALNDNKTWEYVELPVGRKAVGSKWVFKAKQNADGILNKLKARLVAKGYTQIEGIDFNETFAPVVRASTIKAGIAIGAALDLEIYQIDFTTAFLNSKMKEDIYMEQPEGFEVRGKDGQKLVCKLLKCIYGLKQASKSWNDVLDQWLMRHDFKRSDVDPCLYTYNTQDDSIYFILVIYVDDLIIISNKPSLRESLVKNLSKDFKIVDIGHAKWILGVKIEKTPTGIVLNQDKYVMDILTKYGMKDCKPAVTPTVPDSTKTAEANKMVDKGEYLSMVGSLIYLAVISRPDIAYAVSKVGQYMADPKPEHLTAVKRIFRYLKKEPSVSLHYEKGGNLKVIGYVDSDWAGDSVTRKSTTGFIFMLAGAAISWSSKKQTVVALSSTEAEYMAACTATQEAVYLRTLMKDLKMEQVGPTTIYQDNQSSIAIANSDVSSKRTKHIDIRYHYVQEKIQSEEIKIKYRETTKMAADCLTKAVGSQVLDRNRVKIFGTQPLRTSKSEGEC